MTPITTTITGNTGRSLFRCPLLVIALLLFIPVFSLAQPMEYLMKAGFLEKFSRFTDWPAANGRGLPDTPFVISVIGESPFQKSLETLYTNTRINNRPVRIRYISSPQEIDGSDILFIAGSEKNNLEKILQVTRGKPILVVGDTKTFGERGCHINFFVTSEDTLRFEINLKKVKESGLHMHLTLLEVAKIID